MSLERPCVCAAIGVAARFREVAQALQPIAPLRLAADRVRWGDSA